MQETKAIDINLLDPSPYQPRQVFDDEELAELAETIIQYGLIQPIVVRPVGARYEIVAGERRTRAAKYAGLSTIPCLIRAYSDQHAAAVSAVENLGRVQLNAIEEANAYQRLITEFGYTHDEVAAVVGKSRVKVSNCLRLLKCHVRVQGALIDQKISEGHGKILAGLPVEQQPEMLALIEQRALSVRQLERYLKQKPQHATQAAPALCADVARLKRSLSEQLATEVDLQTAHDTTGGVLLIRYYDNDTLAGILDKMKLSHLIDNAS